MNLSEIIANVSNAQSLYMSIGMDSIKIVDEIKSKIEKDFDLLNKAYKLDKNMELSKEKIDSQFELEELPKSDAFKNEFGKVGNVIVPYGVLGVISNSDVYNVLRLIVLGIYTKNGLIINITDSVGTNYLLIQSVKNVLEKYGFANLIEIYNNNSGENLEENEQIDGLIYIGKKANAERLKISTTKPLIYSGCGNYELYIENNLDEELILKAEQNSNIKIYSNAEVGIGKTVKNIEEAITRIEESGNGYAVGIITESRENAKVFVDKIKSRNVFVNALPTLMNETLDIEPRDLMYKKSVLVYE